MKGQIFSDVTSVYFIKKRDTGVTYVLSFHKGGKNSKKLGPKAVINVMDRGIARHCGLVPKQN